MNIENIKEGINSRIDYYKKEREVIYKKKKSYKFTEEEQINGSKIYIKLLEKEKVFNIQIFELEYALGCFEYAEKSKNGRNRQINRKNRKRNFQHLHL